MFTGLGVVPYVRTGTSQTRGTERDRRGTRGETLKRPEESRRGRTGSWKRARSYEKESGGHFKDKKEV